MKEKKPEIVYSEPVNEIMGSPPGKILKGGTIVLFSGFICFVFFAWLIRYPDSISAEIEITTLNPPVTLVSKVSGHIKKLLVKEKETVEAGKLMAVMETTASMDDISLLKSITDTIINPEVLSGVKLPELSQLGEIQSYFAAFHKNISDLKNYTINDFYGNKINSLSEEILRLNDYITRLSAKEKLYQENNNIEEKKFRRDSSLSISEVIPESELEKSHQSLIKINIDLEDVRLELSAKKIENEEKKQLLQDYRIMRTEAREKLILVLQESFENLKAQIRIWENNYLLVSPVEGIVSFTRYWSTNQSVLKDEPVLTVVPSNAGNFVGRINLPMERSGKVKPGQSVNIKLSGYPYLEYGMVRGIIKSKSLVPSGNTYIIEIELPGGLSTLYGKKLEFTQRMSGSAEIITENIRLLQKLVNPVRHMYSKNRE